MIASVKDPKRKKERKIIDISEKLLYNKYN